MGVETLKWKNKVKEGALKFDIDLSEDIISKLSDHARELLLWNRNKNLTAITKPYEVAEKHVLDSVYISKIISNEKSLIDIGSGGGFPGIPIKIIKPDLFVTLVDASRKKVSFLKHIIRKLNLKGIEAIHARAEELHCDGLYASKYNIAVCRAFSSLDTFWGMAEPFINDDGFAAAMKGIENKEEFSKLKDKLKISDDVGVIDIEISSKSYNLPFSGASRNIVLIKKRK